MSEEDQYQRLVDDEQDRKGPTRYQAHAWRETVLLSIADGLWFKFKGITFHSHGPGDNARQIGRYFPGFGGAFDAWMKNGNSFNEMILKQQAHKVISELPSRLDTFDLCFDLDDAEERIASLEEENEKLREQVAAIVETRVALSKQVVQLEKRLNDGDDRDEHD